MHSIAKAVAVVAVVEVADARARQAAAQPRR